VQEHRILSSWDEEYPANISMSGKKIFYVVLYFEEAYVSIHSQGIAIEFPT
jgi:hypothetical protein